MDQYFTPAFFKFLFGFVAIIGLAFGLLYIVTSEPISPDPVDLEAGAEVVSSP
jgi:hypothetical protein